MFFIGVLSTIHLHLHLTQYFYKKRGPFFTEYESLMPEMLPHDQRNSHSDSYEAAKTLEENKMRRKLRFFFMNPVEKWEAKQRFPYKFLVQVFKIVFVTIQVSYYCVELVDLCYYFRVLWFVKHP